MSCKDNSIRGNNSDQVKGFFGESFTDSKVYSFISAKDVQIVVSILTLIIAFLSLRQKQK